MNLNLLTPEEKELLAQAYEGKSVDMSKIPSDRKELLAKAWDVYGPQGSFQKTEAAGLEQAEQYGTGGAVAEKALDMLLLGHGAEAQAGLQSLLPQSVRGYLNVPISQIMDPEARAKAAGPESYTEQRDLAEARLRGYKQSSPIASNVGTGIGLLSGMKLLGSALKAPATLGEAAKQSAILGGIYGGLQDPGTTFGEVSPIQPLERLQGAGIGAVGGALLSPLGFYGGKAIEKGAGLLKKKGAETAFKATGRFTPSEAQAISPQQRQEMGEFVLNRGVIGNIPRSNETLLSRITTIQKNAGKDLDKAVGEVSKIMSQAKEGGFVGGADKATMARDILQKLVDREETGSPEFNRKVQQEMQNFLKAGEGRRYLDINKVQELKSKAGNKVNWGKLKREGYAALTPEEQINLQKYDTFTKSLFDTAEGAATAANKPSLVNKIKAANQDYSMTSKLGSAVNRELGREGARNTFGLTSRIGAVTSDNPFEALLKGLGVKLLDDYGSQVAAKQMYNVGGALQGLNTQAIPGMYAPNIYNLLNQKE